jgi:hypothetical protein
MVVPFPQADSIPAIISSPSTASPPDITRNAGFLNFLSADLPICSAISL